MYYLNELLCFILCVCCVKSFSKMKNIRVQKSMFDDDGSNDITFEMLKESKAKSVKYHLSASELNSDSGSLETMRNLANTTIEVSDCHHQALMPTKESENYDGLLIQYPYAVSIQRTGAHYATGALVGERWVLTTATEFHNIRETVKLFRLRFGSVNCKRHGVVMPIRDIYPHPSFIPGKPSFDVSLLRTPTVVPLSPAVQPIPLSKVSGKIIRAKFLITYWPRIVIKEKILPPSAKERLKYSNMRVSTQKMVAPDRCKEMMKDADENLASSSHCLKPIAVHHSVCMPDVGAPVVARDGLWGITSGWVSPHCPKKPGPTVFTRVTAPSVKLWLNRMLKQTEEF